MHVTAVQIAQLVSTAMEPLTVGMLKQFIAEANLPDDAYVVVVQERRLRHDDFDAGERDAKAFSATIGHGQDSHLRIWLELDES